MCGYRHAARIAIFFESLLMRVAMYTRDCVVLCAMICAHVFARSAAMMGAISRCAASTVDGAPSRAGKMYSSSYTSVRAGGLYV